MARRGHPVWRWLAWSLLLSAGVLVLVVAVVIERAAPILKGRVIETLSARFDSRVELDRLDVSVLRGLEISGGGLRIFPPDDIAAAGATAPLIAVRAFEFHTGYRGLFLKPMRVESVRVTGMEVRVPPREVRAQEVRPAEKRGKIKIVAGEIVCDDSVLVIETAKAGKEPKRFPLRHIVLREVGGEVPWRYDATLVNAIPKGDIHAEGTFGPWVSESPGDSAVNGSYTFDHADLNTIKGIGGMLSSTGKFGGHLDRIEVTGRADVPNFSLDTANQPVPLRTTFHAIVDGMTGDTYLQPVEARLGRTNFTCSGSVVNQKGVGHTIDLDIHVPEGRLEDFLMLSVKTRPVVLTGHVGMKTKLHIGPGKRSVTQKLELRGGFTLKEIHFTNAKVQDKVDMLSLRAQGYAAEAKPGAPDVASKMNGTFAMGGGKLTFSDLDFRMPGASVGLTGVYSLDGEQFDFSGKVRTKAKLSQMVSSWWKQVLIYPANQIFAKNGAGAEIPVKISGTNGEPKFGLDLFHDDKKKAK